VFWPAKDELYLSRYQTVRLLIGRGAILK